MENKIRFIKEEMKKLYLIDKRPWIIGYSGGKDSTVLLQLVYEMLLDLEAKDRVKKVYVISSNTLVENPIIVDRLEKNLNKIRSSAIYDKLPIETHMVYPEFSDSFWTNVIGKGFPTPKSARFRWCTSRLKINPSNKFIEERVSKDGEVIVLLGVRKDESNMRKMSIEKREIEGFILTPHESLNNTYVYSPISNLTTDEIWMILLANGGLNPWRGDNNSLFEMYKDGAGGDCPFTLVGSEQGVESPSCGNTRFGCWTCTVVSEDKSLNGFIQEGEDWLIPLARFRQWLIDNRDNRSLRAKKQRSGRIYKMKKNLSELSKEDIDYYLEEGYKIKKDSKGKKFFWVQGLGPFNFRGRKLILEKLLQTENEIGIELIKIQELREIEKIWNREFDIKRNSLSKIYSEVKGFDLPWSKNITPVVEDGIIDEIEKILEENKIDKELYYRLLILTDEHKNYSNKTDYKNEIDKFLNQQWLHRDIYDERYEDDNK